MSSPSKSIMRQLKQLQKHPVPGASAAPCEDNLNEIHCNVIGPAGVYEGVRIHFVLEIGSDYPVNAPNAFFVTPIAYAGGSHMTDAKGRRAVCLNIFNNYKNHHGEWGSTDEGWSPACTLETILVQMQNLLSNADGLLSNKESDIKTAKEHNETITCPCGHKTSSPYPEIEANGPTVVPVSGIVCYSSCARVEDEDALLGIGINVTAEGLSTPGEVLSHEAFTLGVRKSSNNLKTFTHFLPLSYTEDHSNRVMEQGLLVSCLEGISTQLRSMGQSPPEGWVRQLVECVGSVMESMVAEVAQCGRADDRFIECYHALLDTLRRVDGREGGSVQKHIDVMMRDISTESRVPRIASLLALLPLSGRSWEDTAAAVAREADTLRTDLLCFRYLFEALGRGGALQQSIDISEAKVSIKKGFTEVRKVTSREDYCKYITMP